MDITHELSLKQKQILTQQQLQSLELLSMCNTDLIGFLNAEYLENPLLEQDGDPVPEPHESLRAQSESSFPLSSGRGADPSVTRAAELARDPSDRSLKTYIMDQLDFSLYHHTDWLVIDYLIDNLDDNGFYTQTAADTAKHLGVPEPIVQTCLNALRCAEPHGIFAANLPACLLAQAEALGRLNQVLESIILYHLEDISNGKISTITRALGISSLEARKYIAFITTLNPRPLSGFFSGSNTYIVPDVIFSRKDGEWEVILNHSQIDNFHLNDYYLKMIRESTDPELQEYFEKKLERIRFIFNSIEQRRATILSVCQEILTLQAPFFEGRLPLAPMTMTQVAADLNIHVSTVSRAVNDKYIQYPAGCILIKSLFSAAVSKKQDQEGITAEQIKKHIAGLVRQEDPKKPFSDQALTELLAKEGIAISRRGITKYREELGIKSSYERKDY